MKILAGILAIALLGPIAFVAVGPEEGVEPDFSNDNLSIVTSLEDKIDGNAAWCGTFNLIWNDLRDDLAKQDIIFANQTDIVDHLNEGTFTTDDLSEDSYYKVYGSPTFKLKAEIEKAIKEKFDEESDILDSFTWNAEEVPGEYFLYCMLKKEFEFPNVFTKLPDGTFNGVENVKFFGIDGTTDSKVKNQVQVLYYDSEDDFAVLLRTKQNDEVIITVGNKANTFMKIYEDVMKEAEKYKGARAMAGSDRLKVPNIKFDLKENITEVEGKPFLFSTGEEYVIDQAIQTIKFELDEKGGKIKSEAGMSVKATSIAMPVEPRNFLVDETFTIFLREEGEELPYFAAKISDITSIQDIK